VRLPARRRLGIRITIPHYHDFGEDALRIGKRIDNPGAWDTVRSLGGSFGLPRSREERERQAEHPQLVRRAKDIARVVQQLNARSACSYAVGAGALELALKMVDSHLDLTCTEYAPRTVQRLRRLFPEARIIAHDLVREDPIDAELHLLHRVDTELSNREWTAILPRFRQPILFVPAALVDWRMTVRELTRPIRKRRASRAGYCRNEAAFRHLWRASHREESRTPIGDLVGFVLVPL
jgi:hypothetical protein